MNRTQSRFRARIPTSLISLLVVATFVRGGVLLVGGEGLWDDPDAYLRIAQTLAATGTLGITSETGEVVPTAFRPPLYPAVIAGIRYAMITVGVDFEEATGGKSEHLLRAAIALLHLILGVLTVAATYLLARRWLSEDRRPGHRGAADSRSHSATLQVGAVPWFAGLLVAFDPILLQSSTRVMTETVATAFAAAVLLVWAGLVDRLAGEPADSPREPAGPPESDSTDASGSGWRSIIRAAAGLGLLLGLAHLCRPTFFVWTALLIGYLGGWAILRLRRRPTRSEKHFSAGSSVVRSSEGAGIVARLGHGSARYPLGAAVIAFAGVAIVVGGWTLRNQLRFGQPIWATTHGGYTLLLGNNPPFYEYVRHGRFGVAWDADDFFEKWEQRALADPRGESFWTASAPDSVIDPTWEERRPSATDEIGQDRLAYETAKWSIGHDPAGFLQACLWRLNRLLGPMPQRPAETPDDAGSFPGWGIAAVTTFYAVVTIAVLVGIWQVGREWAAPRYFATLALLISLVAVHAVYWSNLRMRAPAVPPLAIIATIGVGAWVGRKNEWGALNSAASIDASK